MQSLPLTLTYTYTNTYTHTSTYTHTYTYQGIEKKQAGKGVSLLAWQNEQREKRVKNSRWPIFAAIVAHSTGPHVPLLGEYNSLDNYLPPWPRRCGVAGDQASLMKGALMLQTVETVCQYCQGPVVVGEADEPMMQNACSVAVKIGLVCARCGFVGQAFNNQPRRKAWNTEPKKNDKN